MYPTSTTTTVKMPEKLEAPAVSLCIRVGDLVKTDNGLWSYKLNDTGRQEHLEKVKETMTLKEIFEKTPPTTNLIHSRLENSFQKSDFHRVPC